MKLQEKYGVLKNVSAELTKMISKLCEELCAKIEDAPTEGVTKISASPKIVTVKLAALGNNWTPAYYIPECQAEAVKRALEKANISNIVHVVCKMIREKRVQTKSGRGYWYPPEYVYLNDNTVRIIRDSELGRFALAQKEEEEERGGKEGAFTHH